MYSICKVTACPTVDFAAEEMKKYLRMMMPRCGEISISLNPEAKDGFRIGLMADFGLDMSDAEDIRLDDIIYIEADEQGGIIAGSNPGATLIAVYRYLKFNGCRWLFPGVDGEWIPVVDGLKKVSWRKLADHRYRGQCNEGAEYQQSMMETIDFTPKIGMNTYMLEFDNPYVYYEKYYNHGHNSVREPEPIDPETILQWKRQCEVEMQKRGLHFHDMGHGWTAEPFGISSTGGWAKSEETDVPEDARQYLAEMNGERKLFGGVALNTNVCMSNPEARSIMAKYIADYAETQNNVDFLHIWMADGHNNHCECEECRKKDVSDWYIMLLNDIDAELTARSLDTHLVFIVYVDSFWPPMEKTLINQKRFTMLYAPITRLYTETYGEQADMDKLVPYNRNHNELPKGMAECLGYLKAWQKTWPGDCFCYEYHFWVHQYMDPSGLYLAKLIYDDITSLHKQGLNGIVEDGSQRSFFPNGLAFYVYGETLLDSTVPFETLVEDYYSHAYGAEWKQALDFLGKIRDRLDYASIFAVKGSGGADNPEKARQAAEIPEITAEFMKVIEANLVQKKRASAVAWQLMKHFVEYVNGYAAIIERLCSNDIEGARKAVGALMDAFSRREIYIERYYDHYLASHVLRSLVK